MADFVKTPLGQWTGIFIAVLTGAIAQTLMKMGTDRVGRFGDTPLLAYILKLVTNPFVLGAVLAYGFGVLFYMFMLSLLDLSYLYPAMVALGLVLATIVSWAIFNENISPLRLGGIGVVILGVFMISQT